MTRFNKAYLLVPVVYIGVIFGLLFLQFSSGERFTRTVGPLLLRATRNVTTEAGEPTVRGLNLEFAGLAFDFESGNGLVVHTSDALQELPVLGFTQNDSGFAIEFAGGFLLDFVVAEEPAPEVQLSLTIPDATVSWNDVTLDPATIIEVNIPFKFVGTATPEVLDRASFVTVTDGDREFFFTAPHDILIDPANEKIILRPAASGRAVRYVEAVTGNPATVLSWFADGANAVGDREYADQVGQFVELAYAGWTSARYNASSLTWDGPAGSPAFSEATLTAYLAEAWRRDDYERAYAEMRRAADLHPESLGLLSSAFLGNLTGISEGLTDADARTVQAIRADLAENRATVFHTPDLFGFAADRGDDTLYDELVAFARSVDLGSVDVTAAVGMLANAVLSVHPTEASADATARFADLVESVLLGSVVQADGLFFLQSAPGQIDVQLSITAGRAIEEVGQNRDDGTLVAVGRNLVTSALSIADRNGMLPVSLVVRGDSVEAGGARFAPEEIYPVVADNPAYPREISLAEEMGRGAWIWTVADLSQVVVSNAEWRLSFVYPRLRTHHLVISGVPAFERLDLFGQTWRDAPDFEIYSKGRYYDVANERLLIKYYDDSVQRDIVIQF